MIYSLDLFLKISKIFKLNQRNLYLVGGTVRDILLKQDIHDFDLATDALPSEVVNLLSKDFNLNTSFIKYGIVRIKINNSFFDIASFRKECFYLDFRHPRKIKFVRKMQIDVKRRDFTINAMYMDDRFKLFDFYGGKKDLDNRLIRMVGNPSRRLKEDPLRILRAIRFSLVYRFYIDEKLKKAIKNNVYLLSRLNPDKIKEELNKIKDVDQNILINIFNEYGITNLLRVIN